MTKTSSSKQKMAKKQSKKKQNTVHPYLECIQGEIASLQEEIHAIEELKNTRDLTDEEQLDLTIKKACLERYQATLTQLTGQSMINKANAHTTVATNIALENRQRETMSFLQLMYLMRLGQLGLYDCIDQAPSLDTVANLCDQIIGAAVYYAKESSPQIKDQKRLKVHELLRKWDQASNDVIDDTVDDGTTFKQLRDFLQHIWDNSREIKNTSNHRHHQNNSEKTYAVLQFEGMIPKEPAHDDVPKTNVSDSESHVETNTTCDPSSQANAPENRETSKTSDHSETLKTPETPESENAEKTPSEASDLNSSEINTSEASRNESREHVEDEVLSVASNNSDRNGKSRSKESNKKAEPKSESWEDSHKSGKNDWNKHGWKSIDNSVKGQSWNNADSQHSEKVIEDENRPTQSSESPVIEPVNPADENVEATESKPYVDSNENDDWRRRDENSVGRGRGRGRGSRGRGKFTDRGRGRGGPRGRGRGRVRDYDEDYNRHYEPTPQPQE
ncbi:uncharacterized protein EV154DRAFT_514587 [Mucor mucedo]|uniref:uncharacterized protein n=1 Tax=Mucor mucedo TaxID=29922 RepID=UPI00221E6AA6|nr:uncharacterized protein EV154DRAFT_514587 [Mucor mucedo]KAI7889403.1 hypothetical protein EV154DRAFT_514587 [Mucor mucedo]